MRAFLTSHKPRPGSRVGATYMLPVAGFGEEELADEKKALTLQARSSFGPPPPPFEAWSVDADGFLHVPRFYGLQRFGAAATDERVDGDRIQLSFVGTLTPVQQKTCAAVYGKYLGEDEEEKGDQDAAPEDDAVLVDRTTERVRKRDAVHGGVMVSLPCGFGKTVWGVHTVVRRNRKALVLVHKAVLRDQWKESFERFCPGVRVGFVQGPTWQVDGYDVVIAMVMTLAKRDLDPSVMDSFGTVVVDEAHHMAAPVMNRAMRLFRARWVVGLSATKDRPDGLTPLLHWSLGPEGFRTERDGEGVRVSVALFTGGTPEILSRANGKPIVSLMINKLAANPRRNAFLADRIATMRKAGRVLMVLSDRVAQLDVLRDLLLRRGIPEEEIGIFKGGMKDAARVVQLARPVVLCSYGMANEGVDKKEADTCVMATPKGRVTQCIGRVQRPCETKQPPLVLDVADDDVAIFQALRWKRQTSYSKEKYEVQVLAHDAGEGRWFT